MSTTDPAAQQPVGSASGFDLSAGGGVPFGRLVGVELRKSADTRAGRWLLGAIVGITAIVMLIFFFVANSEDRIFGNFIGIASTPQGFLLPVLGILLVTSEWSQRTAMVTFALEPSRSRVVAAKTVAALVLATGAYAAAVVIAGLVTLAGGASEGFSDLQPSLFLLFFALQLFTVMQGLAYGLILLNTPAAIVTFFVLPIASSIVFGLVSGLADAAPWIDLGTAQAPLFGNFESGGGEVSLTGEQYAQLGTTTLIWIIAPFIAGYLRVLRVELK